MTGALVIWTCSGSCFRPGSPPPLRHRLRERGLLVGTDVGPSDGASVCRTLRGSPKRVLHLNAQEMAALWNSAEIVFDALDIVFTKIAAALNLYEHERIATGITDSMSCLRRNIKQCPPVAKLYRLLPPPLCRCRAQPSNLPSGKARLIAKNITARGELAVEQTPRCGRVASVISRSRSPFATTPVSDHFLDTDPHQE